MQIKNASIQLGSQHQLQKQAKETESMRVWQRPPQEQSQRPTGDVVKLSEPAQITSPSTQELDLNASLDANDSIKLNIVQRMVKALTGRDFELFSPEQLKGNAEAVEIKTPPPRSQPSQGDGFGLVYERTSSYQEAESTSFSAQGVIETKDGKHIEFAVDLNMSRAFYSESKFTLRAGEPEKIDPLVINFDGNAAELSDTRFTFDIDANGSPDQIAILKPGSGLLALDKNQDGSINDGSELFGTRTGNGFNELAAYDDDRNGFIDEGDAIYNNLRIWQRHEDGSEQLIALGDKNIGAIYLGHVSTPFQLKNQNNESLGEVASTGIYLTENGQTGTIQQIDFSV